MFKSKKVKKEEKVMSKREKKEEENKKYSLDDYVKSELKKKLKQTILSFDEDDN